MSISLLQLGNVVQLKVFVDFLSANEQPLVFVSVKLACKFGLSGIVLLYCNEKDESYRHGLPIRQLRASSGC